MMKIPHLLNQRLVQSICQTLRVQYLPSTKIPFHFACLCTQSCNTSSDLRNVTSGPKKDDYKACLSYRIEKLEAGLPILSAFQSWMRDGFPVHRDDVIDTIDRLRKLKMYIRALEVMEWVVKERPYKPTELDYSYLLEFTVKIHGISQGEKLFLRVPSEFQNDILYTSLILACLERKSIRLSLEYMKKMRVHNHPISHLIFDRLLILNSHRSRRKYIPRILRQMKADKVPPHVSTYNILMKMEAKDHNLDGLGRVFEDMKRVGVEPNEISYCILATSYSVARLYSVAEAHIEAIEKCMSGNNYSTLDLLLTLYGQIGKSKEVERIWGVNKDSTFFRPKGYIVAVEAFGKVGQLDRAEQLWGEMMSRMEEPFSTEHFNCIISVYSRHGIVKKASWVYREIVKHGCKPNGITYRHLALGCLKAGLVEEAVRTLDKGSELKTKNVIRNSTPWLETSLSIVEAFAEIGDVGNTEKMFKGLDRAKYSKYTFVYNALIKAYVKARVYDPELLTRMILGGARPDDETYSLMKLAEQYRCD